MPNHVLNKVRFNCDEEKLKEILSAIKYDCKDGENPDAKIGTIDFNKIVPMPDELDIDSGSTTNHAIELLLTAINPDTKDFGIQKAKTEDFENLYLLLNSERHFSQYRKALTDEEISQITKYDTQESLLKLGNTAAVNMLKYDATTWYDWRINNWGTKWNSYDSSYNDGNEIVFSTAWSAPHPILAELSKRFPEVSISHKWADEDIGNNCGSCEYLNGECFDEITFDGDGEGINFAMELWDYEPEVDIDIIM